MKTNRSSRSLAALTLAGASPLAAQLTGIESANPALYSITERLTGLGIYGGYSVHQGELHFWGGLSYPAAQHYRVYDIASGGMVSDTAVSGITVASNGYGDAFGLFDPAGNTFYVGTYQSSGSGLYSYNRDTGAWAAHGVFDSLYGAAAHNGKIYASGLNTIWNGGVGQDNQIALYDLSGGGAHDVVIRTAGNSAGVAVDALGNVYYANYNGGSAALYRWSAAQIDSVSASFGNGDAGGGAGDIYLTYADGELLTALPAGANGIAVDAGGNVFVAVNDFGGTSGLLMWNDTLGVGDAANYRFIVVGAEGSYGWFGGVQVDGDFLAGGTLYVTAGQGLAEVGYLGAIPEPSAFAALAGLAALGFAAARRRARSA